MPRFLNQVTLILLSIIIAMPAIADELPTVLFDQGHNQRFLINSEGPLQLTGLAGIFREQGFTVQAHSGVIGPANLTGARALVISGAFKPFTPAEIDAISGYLDNGGRLAVMLHIGPPLKPLLDKLGVVVSNGVLHEQENLVKTDDLSFMVTRFAADPLTAGLDKFSLYGGWGLLNRGTGTAVLAKTGDKAWIDLNGDRKLSAEDAVQSYAVIVSGTYGKGRFVIFGDDAIFQNQFLDEHNAKLAANLAKWLK